MGSWLELSHSFAHHIQHSVFITPLLFIPWSDGRDYLNHSSFTYLFRCYIHLTTFSVVHMLLFLCTQVTFFITHMPFEIDSNVSLERLPRPEYSHMEQKSLLLNVSGQPFYAQSFTNYLVQNYNLGLIISQPAVQQACRRLQVAQDHPTNWL